MKRCPECRRDYFDDTLLYCLDDGASLLEGPASSSESPTVAKISSESPTIKIHTTNGVVGEDRPKTSQKWPWMVLVSIILAGVAGFLVYSRQYYKPANTQNTSNVSSQSPNELFLRGKLKARSDDRDDVEEAIRSLEQVVALDPNNAEAYAYLAQALTTKAFQFAPASEQKQISDNAELDVEKALTLNPDLAEGHYAQGIILWTHAKRFPHEQAIQSFKRAIALKPDLDQAHEHLGMIYLHIGLLNEAAMEIKKAIEINPNNTMARFRSNSINTYLGKYEDAMAILKTVPRDQSPALVDSRVAEVLVHLNRLEEANTIVDNYLKTYPQDEGGNVTSVKALILAKYGKNEEAEAMIERAIEVGKGFGHFHHTAYNIASAYAIMNKPDEAMRWLQDAADDGFPNYPYFGIDHNLDNLRGDPRFVEFLSKGKIQTEKFRTLASS